MSSYHPKQLISKFHMYSYAANTLQDQLFRNVKFELIDECGEVNTISEHVAMMVPFYYIPLLLLLIVLVVKLSLKIRATYKIR